MVKGILRATTSVGTALAVIGALASAVPAAAAATGPILTYTFDRLPAPGLPVAANAVVEDQEGHHDGVVVNAGASVVAGPSGLDGDRALSLPGGANTSAAPFVRIAPGLLDGTAGDVTLSAWVKWSGSPACTWPYTLGSDVNKHVLATTQCGSYGYGAIKNGANTEVRATAGTAVPSGTWAHLAVVVDGGSFIKTYINGVEVGSAATTHTAAAAVGAATFSGYLGKSFYSADAYWKGAIDDFSVYASALTGAQVAALGEPVFERIAQADIAAISLGDTGAVTGNLALPVKGSGGSTLTWASSDPAVVSPAGAVTRPAAGSPDATVELTPTATFGTKPVQGSAIRVTVKAWPAGEGPDTALVAEIVKALPKLPAFTAPVRGSITLPETGGDLPASLGVSDASRAVITWSSSDSSAITDTDRGTTPNVTKKGSVTRGKTAKQVTLTATVTVGDVKDSVDIDVEVPAMPDVDESDYEAYVFAYFTGDNIDGEKIRLATSDGNNALKWQNLNNAQPILESTKGDMGLRDPFIMRSKEGDRFFLIATDLSVGREGWGDQTVNGSRYLEIWESTDLVHWGEQRHVLVSPETAGMTWAPEAYYDDTIDAYVVYWTSTMYTDASHSTHDGNGPQIFYATTRDFVTFSDPVPWFKAADEPGLVKAGGLIDSTVLKDGDTYYRFTKGTQVSGCASPDILGQKSATLRATNWTLIDQCIGRTAGTPEVEGPSVFKANPGDTHGGKYYLWVDNYGGVGYIPLTTDSLKGDIDWRIPPVYSLPVRPRHGTVMGITREERDSLAGAFAADLLVTSVEPVNAPIAAGTRTLTLPETVKATFKDGHTAEVAVTWDAFDLSSLTKAGDSLTVKGKLGNGAATPATVVVTVTSDPIPLASLTVTGASHTLRTGATSTLKAVVSPFNATVAGVNWTSSRPDVATVDEAGVVTAVAKGSTTITAKAGDKTAGYALDVVTPPADLLLRYGFDDPSATTPGSRLTDLSGRGFDGRVSGDGATSTEGRTGAAGDSALRLPGGTNASTAAYVTIPQGVIPPDADDLTVSAWVRWDGAGSCEWAFGLGESSTRNLFASPRCGNTLISGVKVGAAEVRATGSAPLSTQKWSHVTVVLDGGSSITTYVDGSKVDSKPTTYKAGQLAGSAGFDGYLGKSLYSADPYLGGALDDFRVYGRALTADEVAHLGDPDTTPTVPLRVVASSRCVGSSAYVAVTAVNGADVPATVTLTTPYGSKTVADVAPGKQAYQSFNARVKQLPAGEVTVAGTATVGGQPVTTSYQAAYPAISCG
ncbi:LamG-like jellyroll fold domain-containing protein [Microbispora sp. CA-102843]|uniref:LamG-like jellyroll fold domain-containing protein n=1 Tax=Microbispora sp. CA-102843 TaxID=3239952 RepID=UPI003D8D7C2D